MKRPTSNCNRMQQAKKQDVFKRIQTAHSLLLLGTLLTTWHQHTPSSEWKRTKRKNKRDIKQKTKMPQGCSELQRLSLGEGCFISTVGCVQAHRSLPQKMPLKQITNQTKQRILKGRGIIKNTKWHVLWKEYCVSSPALESVCWHHVTVWRFFSRQNRTGIICFHCVTLHKTTTHNNWKKEASGDTDGSTNCLRVGGIPITSFALKLL